MLPDICDWLRDQLGDGAVEVTLIRQRARAAGYTRGELREAKRLCGVVSTNNWSEDHPFTDRWFWSLPKEDT